MAFNKFLHSTTGKSDIIFDFDNTIFFLEMPWVKWQQSIKKVVSKVSNLDIDTHTSNWATNINFATTKYPDLLPKLIQVQTDFETHYLSTYKQNDQLIDWIKQNETNFTFHIWSSQTMYTIETILNKHKLTSLFTSIYCRSNLDNIKPNPEGFYQINSQHKSKDNFLMVGDSSSDKNAAKNSGIDYCYLAIQ